MDQNFKQNHPEFEELYQDRGIAFELIAMASLVGLAIVAWLATQLWEVRQHAELPRASVNSAASATIALPQPGAYDSHTSQQ